MISSLAEEKTNLSPEQLKAQLLQELNGHQKDTVASEKSFSDLVPVKPTELAPLHEDAPVVGKKHGPLTKEATKRQIYRESPEGQAAQEDLRSLNIGPTGYIPDSGEIKDALGLSMDQLAVPYDDLDSKVWKNKLRDLRSFLNKIASTDKTRKKVSVIANYALGATSNAAQVASVLKQAISDGVFKPREIQSFEDLVGFKIDNDETANTKDPEAVVDSVNNTETLSETNVVDNVEVKPIPKKDPYETKVKLSRVIDIPKFEMKSKVKVNIKDPVYSKDAEAIVSSISKKELKKSEILEKSRGPLPKKTDNFFGNEKETTPEQLKELALASFQEGEIGDALVCVDRIKDLMIQAETAGEIVEKCVNNNDFETAHRFLSEIDYLKYKKDLSLWLSSIEMGQAAKEQKKSKSNPVSEVEPKAEVKVKEKLSTEEVISSKDDIEDDLELNKESADIPDIDVVIPKEPKEFDESLVLREKKKAMPEIPAKKVDKGEVQPADVKTADHVKVSKPVSPEAAKPKTPEDEKTIEKNLEMDLGRSREEYVRQYIDWEYKTRISKNLFARTLLDLGVTRPAPERLSLRTTALEDARDEYLKARASTSLNMMGDVEKLLSHATEERLLIDKMKQDYREQKEREDVENGVEKAKLDKVAERIKKGWDIWTSKTTPNQRLLISAGLLSTGVLVTGGLGAAAGYAGYRVARGAVGAMAGQVTGRGVDFIQKNINERREASTGEKYISEISAENILAKEAELLEYAEKDKVRKKRQLFAKAGAMIGVGVAAGVGSARAVGASSEALHSLLHGHIDNPHMPDLPPSPSNNIGEALSMKSAPDQVLAVEVPVSSKGFIDTIHNIKSEIINKYGGESNVPEDLHRTLLDKSDVDLAKSLNMYDPKQNLSAVLEKGDTISLNSSGNLIYNHTGGNSEIILDTQTGLTENANVPLHDYSVKPGVSNVLRMEEMNKVDPGDTIVVDHEVRPILNITEENIIPVENTPDSLVESVGSVAPAYVQATFNGSPVDLVNLDNGIGRAVVYHGQEIAHEYSVGDHKTFYLDDQYQDNPAFKEIRGAFNEFYEKNIGSNTQVIKPLDFEGGKIYILKDATKSNTVNVFLNGKEIGTGVVDGAKVKMNILSNLKGGWFLADNAYERAFKVAKDVMTKGKITI